MSIIIPAQKRHLSPAQRLSLTGECALLVAHLGDDALIEHVRALRKASGLRPDRCASRSLYDRKSDVARVKRA